MAKTFYYDSVGLLESTIVLTISIDFFITEGSPGPLDNIYPSGLIFSISSKDVFNGNTVTLAPLSVKHLTMFFLTPKSSNAI